VACGNSEQVITRVKEENRAVLYLLFAVTIPKTPKQWRGNRPYKLQFCFRKIIHQFYREVVPFGQAAICRSEKETEFVHPSRRRFAAPQDEGIVCAW
jgi:hypothetical protein